MNYGPPSEEFAGRMRLIFKTWTDLYNERPEAFSNRWPGNSLKKFSPIEFLATGVLLDTYLQTRSNETMIQDIVAMREYIRTGNKVVDLRTNTGTWRWFWEYIDDLESHRGAGITPPKDSRAIPEAVQEDSHHENTIVEKSQLILPSGPLAVGIDTSSQTPRKTPNKTPKKARHNSLDVEPVGSPIRKSPAKRGRPRKSIGTPVAATNMRSASHEDLETGDDHLDSSTPVRMDNNGPDPHYADAQTLNGGHPPMGYPQQTIPPEMLKIIQQAQAQMLQFAQQTGGQTQAPATHVASQAQTNGTNQTVEISQTANGAVSGQSPAPSPVPWPREEPPVRQEPQAPPGHPEIEASVSIDQETGYGTRLGKRKRQKCDT